MWSAVAVLGLCLTTPALAQDDAPAPDDSEARGDAADSADTAPGEDEGAGAATTPPKLASPGADGSGGIDAVDVDLAPTEPVQPVVTLPKIQAPIQGEPQGFVASRGFRGALLKDGHRLVELGSNRVVAQAREKESQFKITRSFCAVGAKPFTGCVHVGVERLSKTVKEVKTVKGRKVEVAHKLTWNRTKVAWSDSDGGYVPLAKREDSVPHYKDKSVGTRYNMILHGLHINERNQPVFLYTIVKTVTTRDSKDRLKREATSNLLKWTGGEAATAFELQGGPFVRRSSGSAAGHPTRHNPTLQFVELGDEVCVLYSTDSKVGALEFECLDSHKRSTPVEEAMYDYRLVQGADGWLYVFYHEPNSESTMVTTSRDGQNWTPRMLDAKESGWQLDAASDGDTVTLAYYYFRNSFNKGLRALRMRGGEVVEGPMTLVREADHNTGWYPFLGVGTGGGVWLTYWEDVLAEERVWTQVSDPGQLATHTVSQTGNWEDHYKFWYLQAGAGAWFAAWNLQDFAPSAEDANGLKLGATEYVVGDALLGTTTLEGEFFGYSLAMSYSRSILEDAQAELEDEFGEEAVDFVSGQLKIDKIFPGHDVKVQFTFGNYRGVATAGEGVINEQQGFDNRLAIDTTYVDAQALFLNKWRMKYGLALTRYNLPMVLHTYHAPEDVAEYNYTGSFFRDVQTTGIKALFGYSTLDYVSKYENAYYGFILDIYGDVGVNLMSFDPITPLNVDDKEDSTFSLDTRVSLNLGYLLFQRWYSTYGFGFYFQPAYMVEAHFTGLPGKPGDRDLDTDEDASNPAETWIQPAVLGFRHGPRLDLGVVW